MAIAVREFGVGLVKLDVGVAKNNNGELSAVVSDLGRPSLCSASVTELPAFVLRAEVLSLRDGHLIAHIDETRPLRPASALKRSIVTTTVDTKTVKDAYGRESVINETTDVTCQNTQQQLTTLIEEIRRSQVARVAGEELLKTGFGPVFRSPQRIGRLRLRVNVARALAITS
jgi:hypothetical protein